MSIKVLSETGLTELVTKTKTWVRSNFLKSSETTTTSTIDVDSTPTSSSTNLVTSGGVYTSISAKQDAITSSNKLSASLVSGLATVATTGSYADLSNKPTMISSVSLASGTNNGTLKLTVDGTSTDNVAVTGLGSAAMKDVASTISSGNTDLATSGQVFAALDALPEPMVFIGSVGTGGTIEWSALPAASSVEGHTYKVITDHATTPICKVGDTIISNGTDWVVIPSGDDPSASGSVTSVGIANTGGLTVSGGPITVSGTLSVGHSNTAITPITTQTICPITVDAYGHITSYGTSQALIQKVVSTITGTGDQATFRVTHSLNTSDVLVQIYDTSDSNANIEVDIYRASTYVDITFTVIPTASQTYKVIIIG